MLVFAGTYEFALDAKGRVVLPLGLRKCARGDLDELVKKGFMLRPADDNEFLELYPSEEFDAAVKSLVEDYKPQHKDGQNYLRRFTGPAVAISLDPQFRFVIPDKLKAAAGISSEVFFVGVPGKIEIWARDRYEGWEKKNWNVMIPPVVSGS